MEPKEKMKKKVLLEGGQQFIVRFSTKEQFNKYPDVSNYLKEINLTTKINP